MSQRAAVLVVPAGIRDRPAARRGLGWPRRRV